MATKKAAAPADDTGTALIPLETIKAKEIFVVNGTDSLIAIVEAEVEKFKPDVTTEEGRKEIGRLDRKIASSKNGIEKLKLEYTAELRQTVTDINAEGKRFFTRMEELQEQVSAPLDAWKAKEKERVDGHKDRLAKMTALATIPCETVMDVDLSINSLNDLHDESYDWEDFLELATAEYDRVMAILDAMKPVLQKRADDAAELEKLRAAQAERDKKDADDLLIKQGEEKAKKDAQDAIDEANRKAAQAETDRKNRLSSGLDTLASLRRMPETSSSVQIKSRIEEMNRYHANFGDWQEHAEKAETMRATLVQELQVLADGKATAEQAQRDKDAADAIQRQKDADAKAERDREADKAHRGKINTAALDAMVEHSKVSHEDCQAVLVAIAKGLVPNVKISY